MSAPVLVFARRTHAWTEQKQRMWKKFSRLQQLYSGHDAEAMLDELLAKREKQHLQIRAGRAAGEAE